ncbi:MAG: hypothetical protein N4J56_006684 [Chroococcidiopsis sp. SAG 2025]|uniref:hypothetical protein n=1 Tax=Chroococcidiopsis sp. SAG 2025 TaxID=171389 RepID=UPI002936E02B|nr:hypothetical protein [Chroococcidiopsis sp. SAG 2025]MDV2996979.1 hypothetical protein [Chroococcidiopsis sp. SAG 2025]
MVGKLDRKTVAQLVEEAEKLTPRELYVLISKLIGNLKADYALALSEDLEKVTTDKLLEEDRNAIKIEYRVQPRFSKRANKIINNIYAWIVGWSASRENKYMGPAYFLPHVKYRIVDRKTKTVSTLVGLGFHREQEQVFLKILYLTPTRSIESYLYYDASRSMPTAPRAELEETLIAPVEIQCLGIVENDPDVEREATQSLSDTLVEAVATMVVKEDLGVTQAPERPASAKKVLPTNEPQPPQAPAVKTKTTKTISYKRLKERTIRKELEPKVLERVQQWLKLSRVAPNVTQWRLREEEDKLSMVDAKDIALVSYCRTSRQLCVENIRSLAGSLKTIAEAIIKTDSLPLSYHEAALRWLNQIDSAPSGADELLDNLFFL